MCIIHLNGNLFTKVVQCTVCLLMRFDNGVNTCRYKEIFLHQSLVLTLFCGIIRIQLEADIIYKVQIVSFIHVGWIFSRFSTP